MRKLLLGATALTAVTAVQSASAAEIADGLTLGATVRMEMLLSGEHEVKADGETTKTDGKIGFKDTTTELTLGYATQVDGFDVNFHYEITGSVAGDADESSVTISTGGTSVMFGRNDGAADAVAVGIPSVGTGLIDGSADGYVGGTGSDVLLYATDSGDNAKIMLTQTMGGIKAAVSYAPSANTDGAIDFTKDATHGDNFIEAGASYSQDLGGGMVVSASGAYTTRDGGKTTKDNTVTTTEGGGSFAVAGKIEAMGVAAAAGYVSNDISSEAVTTDDTTTTTAKFSDSKTGFWVSATYAIPGIDGVSVGASYGSATTPGGSTTVKTVTSAGEVKKTTSGLDIEHSHMSFGVAAPVVAGVGASLEYASYGTEMDSNETSGSALLARLTAGF